MKKILIVLSILFLSVCGYSQEQTIFTFGGDINIKFIQYVIDLTGKSSPKVCYVPTASADNEDNIKLWNFYCKQLSIDSHVLKVWVSSSSATKTFEEILLDMDAIVVGGGNTLNMLGIWKAQGIDEILNKALNKGFILAGGSAGSICWFQNGISDSRPVNLSVVDGLAFLPYSHCPHFSEKGRKELYYEQMINRKYNDGYACDNKSGVLFKNGKFIESVSLNDNNNSYFISLKNDSINTQKLESKILINKDALPETAYTTIDVNKKVSDFPEIFNTETPLNTFISLKYILANGQQSKLKQLSAYALQDALSNMADSKPTDKNKTVLLNAHIFKVLIYNDSIAGVINKYNDEFYSLWYFSHEDGKWLSSGEDVGGDTVFEAEITFREKVKIIAEKIKK
jgi:peptidase E